MRSDPYVTSLHGLGWHHIDSVQVRVPEQYSNMDYSDVPRSTAAQCARARARQPPAALIATSSPTTQHPDVLPSSTAMPNYSATQSHHAQLSVLTSATTAAAEEEKGAGALNAVPGRLGKWSQCPDRHMQRTQRHCDPLEPRYTIHGRDVVAPPGIGKVRKRFAWLRYIGVSKTRGSRRSTYHEAVARAR